MNNKFILFLLLFCNLYNPGSVYLTLLVNILVAVLLLSKKEISNLSINTNIVITSIFVFLWLLFIILIRLNFSSFIVGKYIRSGASAFIISLIVCNHKFDIDELIESIKIIFLIHIFSIGLQTLFPSLDYPMAKIFGFDRESDIISSFSIRKLGCSSSYDTSGYLCVASMIYFLILYTYKNKKLDLLFSLFSLIASLRTSRTAMILGTFIFLIYFLIYFFKSKGIFRFYAFLSLSLLLLLFLYFVLPIILASTDFLVDYISNDSDINYSDDYSSGSFTGLTGSHLDPLSVPFIELFLGYGIDPNQIGKGTDIGYIKILYHIGIVGLIAILSLYSYFLYTLNKIRIKQNNFLNFKILTNFLNAFIILLLLINYKSLEILSRGSHDFLIIIFLIILFNSKKSKSILE